MADLPLRFVSRRNDSSATDSNVVFSTKSPFSFQKITIFVLNLHFFAVFSQKMTFLHRNRLHMSKKSSTFATGFVLGRINMHACVREHKVLFIYSVVCMDTFLDLPFWLSVALGVVYGAIWLVFIVVLYASHHRASRRRYNQAGVADGGEENVSVFRSHSSSAAGDSLIETTVYDEDDD